MGRAPYADVRCPQSRGEKMVSVGPKLLAGMGGHGQDGFVDEAGMGPNDELTEFGEGLLGLGWISGLREDPTLLNRGWAPSRPERRIPRI